MVSKERGNLPGSHYYFFTPSKIAEEFYYYLVWCGHYYCKFGYDIHRDYYSPLLLVYVIKGLMRLDYEGKHYEITEGQSFLIDCQLPHRYRSTDGLEFVYFHFDGVNSHAFVRHLIKQNNSPVFQGFQSQKVGKVIYDSVTRFLNNQNLSEIECSSAIYETLCLLSVREEIASSESTPVHEAVNYMKKNLNRQISLEEIATYVNISPYYFSRIFKSETGYSPVKYTTKLRLNLAMTLLKTTSSSIESIAYEVGYSSSASFINSFVHNIGISPNQFRKMPI